MDATELIKKVRAIEIKTRGLSKHVFAGEYHSAFKGRGMAFAEVREYQFGDDVRSIDWNVTARQDKAYIKVFEEERELTVMLLVDMSGSKMFGTRKQFKQDLVTELAAVLSFSAIQNNDKIGVIFFSDKIEKFIPPQKGKTHILRIIRELIDFQPQSTKTDIAGVLQYFTNVIKKRATVFLISDFIAENYTKALQIASYKHDLVALQIYDIGEEQIPNIGFVKMKDAETAEEIWVNTSNKRVRTNYARHYKQQLDSMLDTFKKLGVDSARLRTDQDYIKPLLQLFKHR